MLRSRVISGIDTERLSNAVSRPGIDPRIWVSYAVLTDDPVVDMDPGDQDVIANVMLMPSGTIETARVGSIYAGNGFGLYTPLYKGDEVLVVAPSGDPDQGLVITQRLWSPSDPPPDGLNIEDLTLVIQPDKNLRIKTLGGGNVYLTVDTGKIYLGSLDGTEPAAKGQSLKTYLEAITQVFNTHLHVCAAPGSPSGPPVSPPPVTNPPTPPSGTGFPIPTDALLATTTEVK